MVFPGAFADRMRGQLGAEYDAFEEAFLHGPRAQALRVCVSKIADEELSAVLPAALEPVPWAEHAFYYGETDRPGRHPLHEAGLYYIQEPSAMAAAPHLGARPGERVLDLCAAPGGKTTQIAAMMGDRGLLVANEIHPARARILSQNIERMGIRCAVVTNETPERLAERFPGYFDRILVDAPCSGEGMFRKEPQAVTEWSEDNVRLCAERQAGILDCAAAMLREGGRLVYSTCTFSPDEDEVQAASLAGRHPDMVPVDLPAEIGAEKMAEYGFAAAPPGGAIRTGGSWTDGTCTDDSIPAGCGIRLWPHRLRGEGHFAAAFVRGGTETEPLRRDVPGPGPSALPPALRRLWDGLRVSAGLPEPGGWPVLYGDEIYLMPAQLDTRGLRVIRAGLHLATVKKGRIEPAHALAMALLPGELAGTAARHDCADAEEAERFLRGETLAAPAAQSGWMPVCYGGAALGWGKASGGVIKNHRPRGLRILWETGETDGIK